MNIRHSFKTSLRSLAVNRSRSSLTILGIVIGITAIILVMSLGQGAQNLILQQVQGIGSKTIAIIPGGTITSPSDVAATLINNSLTINDLNALQQKSNVPTLSAITPILFGSKTASYGDQTYALTLYGVAPSMQEIMDISPAEGNFFTDSDITDLSQVAVIGSKVQQSLFGDQPAVGKRIKIGNNTFIIIGTLAPNGASAFVNFDEAALIPWSTMQNYVLGIKYFNRLIAEADSIPDIDRTVSDISATLRSDHGITDPSKDDFTVQTQAALANSISLITTAFTLFLLAVAGISLVVGGVGIMNIMLVSVTERTREIGLRKAIGATDRDIMVQFLLEAVLLTGIGGAIGIILGSLISFLIGLIIIHFGINWQFSFPYMAAIIGLATSAIIGLVFGIYPARQASKKSPIEALRYE
jgi:putative ABC transport system permease protein